MEYDYDYEQSMKKVKKYSILAAIVLIVLYLLITFFSYYVDYIEIRELGEQYTSVFFTNLTAQLSTQFFGLLAVLIILYVTFLIVKRVCLKQGLENKFLKKQGIFFLLFLMISFFASGVIRDALYPKLLIFLNSTGFSVADPVFHQDISYYMMIRPFLQSTLSFFSSFWFMVTVVTAVAYLVLLARNQIYHFAEVFKIKPVMMHNLANIIIFFVLKAVSYKFTAEGILYGTFAGELNGSGYVNTNIWMNFYKIIPFVLAAIVIAVIVLVIRGKYLKGLITCAVYPALFVVVSVVAAAVNAVSVAPNEIGTESKYIQYNIEATRHAYDLDNITAVEFPAENNLDAQKLEENKKTIDNIRIVDFPATLSASTQLQAIRNYYKFNDLDIAKYNIGGQETAVGISPREMYKENLDASAQNYNNIKFRFTHGYGVVMNPLNQVSGEGQPLYYIKDIPPKVMEGAPEITEPRIYFGESTNDYVFTNAKQKEFDYFEDNKDVEYEYQGSAGVKLNLLNRIIYSVKNGDWKMLISDLITSDTKILINRNVTERAKVAAPFLTYDNDPYMLINDDGRLIWVIDAYTTSDSYPYAQRYGNINYIRNSVKVTIDAYSGEMKFYVIDETDPLIQSYQKIYPKLFEQEPLPADISEHVKYPEFIFKIQAEMYKKYHVDSPEQFYSKNDMWEIAKEKYSETSEIMNVEPYYNLMQLTEVGGTEEELVLMLPYTLVNRDNMVSWLAARSDGENYGKLVIYKFPKDKSIYGPLQIENRIDNDPNISQDLTLWRQGGSTVIRGNLLTIPVGDSLLYVEPVYITSQNAASLPEIKRIVVAYDDKVVMEPTLTEGLNKIFGSNVMPETPQAPAEPGQSGTEQTPQQPSAGNLNQQLIDAYAKVQQYQKAGDWENFGKAMSELEKIIGQISQQQ